MRCPHSLLLPLPDVTCCTQIAAALQAEKLIIMIYVPGVLKGNHAMPTFAANAAS
jgi:acetylglutamate kinase